MFLDSPGCYLFPSWDDGIRASEDLYERNTVHGLAGECPDKTLSMVHCDSILQPTLRLPLREFAYDSVKPGVGNPIYFVIYGCILALTKRFDHLDLV